MKRPPLSLPHVLFGSVLTAGAYASYLTACPWLGALDLALYDRLAAERADGRSNKVAIVAIDERSLHDHGYPSPKVAEALEKLASAGVKAAAVDVPMLGAAPAPKA